MKNEDIQNFYRGRRQRKNNIIRDMVAETKVNKSSIIYPIFIKDGENIKEEISSMPNQYRYSIDLVNNEIRELLNLGIKNIILFGIPYENDKNEIGTGAYIDDGIIQRAIKSIKKEFKNNINIITDVCMCEYTNHGHCGILCEDTVDNDKTIKVLANIALSHVRAGADIVAPSDMMDGRILEIRNILDKNGFVDTPILSYSAKYNSAFYGPFREAANSSPSFGDRKTYQMDFRNKKQAIQEVVADIKEGADMIMVKPALSYLDIINEISRNINLPLCVYSVSGEYSMIKLAGKNGLLDEEKIIIETTTSIYRAGANMLITYFAKEIAELIDRGLM